MNTLPTTDKIPIKQTPCFLEKMLEKHEIGEKDTKDDAFQTSNDQISTTPIDHGTQILYQAAVNKNGIKLHPQPTSDSLDPLNWSSFQKHTILAIVMFKYVPNYLDIFCRSKTAQD